MVLGSTISGGGVVVVDFDLSCSSMALILLIAAFAPVNKKRSPVGTSCSAFESVRMINLPEASPLRVAMLTSPLFIPLPEAILIFPPF